MAISADGRLIVSGSWDKSIKVFDIHTKEQLHHFSDVHSGTISSFVRTLTHFLIDSITSVAIPADGRVIVSGSRDKSIKVFNMQTKEQLHHFSKAHSGTSSLSLVCTLTSHLIDWILSVAISADGRFIVSGSRDKSMKVFDMHTKEQVHHFSNAHSSTISPFCMHTHFLIGGINSVAISPDGRFIISGSDDNSINVFDMHTKEQLHRFSDAHSGTSSLFSMHTHFLPNREYQLSSTIC